MNIKMFAKSSELEMIASTPYEKVS